MYRVPEVESINKLINFYLAYALNFCKSRSAL